MRNRRDLNRFEHSVVNVGKYGFEEYIRRCVAEFPGSRIVVEHIMSHEHTLSDNPEILREIILAVGFRTRLSSTMHSLTVRLHRG